MIPNSKIVGFILVVVVVVIPIIIRIKTKLDLGHFMLLLLVILLILLILLIFEAVLFRSGVFIEITRERKSRFLSVIKSQIAILIHGTIIIGSC
jgi:hypothetical protein